MIPGWCSLIFGIWREVLGCIVYITSQYFFPAIIYRDIISHITSTYRNIMYFFRTFKKSTAQYKVHNMGLRYIKRRDSDCNREEASGKMNVSKRMDAIKIRDGNSRAASSGRNSSIREVNISKGASMQLLYRYKATFKSGRKTKAPDFVHF